MAGTPPSSAIPSEKRGYTSSHRPNFPVIQETSSYIFPPRLISFPRKEMPLPQVPLTSILLRAGLGASAGESSAAGRLGPARLCVCVSVRPHPMCQRWGSFSTLAWEGCATGSLGDGPATCEIYADILHVDSTPGLWLFLDRVFSFILCWRQLGKSVGAEVGDNCPCLCGDPWGPRGGLGKPLLTMWPCPSVSPAPAGSSVFRVS